MSPVTRLRHELARHPWIHRSLVATLVITSVAITMSWAAGVEAERAEWGRSTEVLVTTSDVEVGTPIAVAVARVRHPAAVVPPRALPADAADAGHVIRRHLPAGVVVTDADVGATSGPRSLLGPDQLAVAVTERIASGARVGDPVVVVTEGIVLTAGATVVAIDDSRVLLAVHHESAAMVAAAAAGPAGVSLLLEP